MPGNRIGGLKAAQTNLKKQGPDFYRRIGAKGGRNGSTGGFAGNSAAARAAGAKGGRISHRGPGVQDRLVKHLDKIMDAYNNGASYISLANKYECCVSTMSKFIKKHC